MTHHGNKNNWLDQIWSSNKKTRDFADEEDPGYDFIIKIEREMERLQLTRAQLAGRLGTSAPSVTQMLSHGRNLTVRSMVRLAKAIGHRIELDIVPAPEFQLESDHPVIPNKLPDHPATLNELPRNDTFTVWAEGFVVLSNPATRHAGFDSTTGRRDWVQERECDAMEHFDG